MTVYIGRIANQRKIPKWLPFENYITKYLTCIWGINVHMCTKYELSMSNPVPGGGVHRH